METWWIEMLSMAFALFLLMDSIGNVPIFISVLKDISPKRHSLIIFRELMIALVIMIAFNYVGEALLTFLNISMPTILISGGIILFLIAIKMIFPPDKNKGQAKLSKFNEPFIVPLAVPLIAGPAVLAAIMIYSRQEHPHDGKSICAIILAWVVSTLILLSSSFLKKIFGERGLIALERLMGLILTLLAVQMFLEGVHQFSALK